VVAAYEVYCYWPDCLPVKGPIVAGMVVGD